MRGAGRSDGIGMLALASPTAAAAASVATATTATAATAATATTGTNGKRQAVLLYSLLCASLFRCTAAAAAAAAAAVRRNAAQFAGLLGNSVVSFFQTRLVEVDASRRY